jgi:hypothetical protein
MFCPKCATQNIDGAHYCRACGANLSLVPQALSGQLPQVSPFESRISRRMRRRQQPTLDEGVRTLVMGFGFIAVALALALFGRPIGANVWWFWMLIPAFGMLGRGISEILRANQLKSSAPQFQHQIPNTPQAQNFAPNTNELRPSVPSVTEGTTRLLDHDSDRPYEPLEDRKPS